MEKSWIWLYADRLPLCIQFQRGENGTKALLTTDANVVINECAGVLQYAQTVFEGLKAYTTKDGKIVTFRLT